MPSSGIAGSYAISIFSFLRNLHTNFYIVTGTHVYNLPTLNGLHFSTPFPEFAIICFLDEVHSDRAEIGILRVALICIFMMAKDIEYAKTV